MRVLSMLMVCLLSKGSISRGWCEVYRHTSMCVTLFNDPVDVGCQSKRSAPTLNVGMLELENTLLGKDEVLYFLVF